MLNREFEYSVDTYRHAIDSYYLLDEAQYIQGILQEVQIPRRLMEQIQEKAAEFVTHIRNDKKLSLDAFLSEYDLSNEEGIVLMCLSESLLRIPDKYTLNKLINEKLVKGQWHSHLGQSHSIFVNMATKALMLGKLVAKMEIPASAQHQKNVTVLLKKLLNKGGEPLVRSAIMQMMKMLGQHFVIGRSINEAISHAAPKQTKGYQFSFDMLGEAALTKQDAKKYLNAYQKAIQTLGEQVDGENLFNRPSISVKLSALHPRFSMAKRERLFHELLPALKELIIQAKTANIGFTIDAEEAQTLEINLDLIDAILSSEILKDWKGFGLAVQAYQKRATKVLDWLIYKARLTQTSLTLRLVKGAYWDTEIKLAQVQGLSNYPVFTRKMNTDVNYIACIKKLLNATDVIYPQFATHNALSLATVMVLAKEYNVDNYECQCLYGMGEKLYDHLVKNREISCRVYAPVGSHEDLLPYLIRRLLENGANTSFVNRIENEKFSVEELIADPIEKVQKLKKIAHPGIALPGDLFSPTRQNSSGIDFSSPLTFLKLLKEIEHFSKHEYNVKPTVNTNDTSLTPIMRFTPVSQHQLGTVVLATKEVVFTTLDRGQHAFEGYKKWNVNQRVLCLQKMAALLEKHRAQLMSLLIYEGGKTIEDAQNELREAVDYCYYYAMQAKALFEKPMTLSGPTGESNQLSLHSRGIIACISPWNFPLAIFLGQITGSLAAGNCVIAKPASQTPIIAAVTIDLLNQAGFKDDVVQYLPGSSTVIGNVLVSDLRIKGVVFTGSTQTARSINQQLAARVGPIIPFIAETGGQNAMIVDSSALSEQVTRDVITSAFNSAGQRCSALRVLFIQEEVADKFLTMIQGAMEELKVGHPGKLSTDIGPLIDDNAKMPLQEHINHLKKTEKLLYQVPISNLNNDSYFGPCLFEISTLDQLTKEVFGPILHVVRYKAEKLDEVIAQINRTGYGLTLGIHSRVEETIDYIVNSVNVGNIYVNRNMIGAVVGVQPFGGEGLSGTGPKAGGPYYLPRLATERTLSVNTAALGGNASLLTLNDILFPV